jgi:hypothetical protein
MSSLAAAGLREVFHFAEGTVPSYLFPVRPGDAR